MAKDFQVNTVYAWENRRFLRKNMPEMSKEDCTALVADVCKCYGLPMIDMHFEDGYQSVKKGGFYSPYSSSITLYRAARNRPYIFHEVAHHIHHKLGTDGISHGKEFFGILAYLLSEYMSIPLYEIFHKAERDGVQFERYTFPRFKEGMTPDAQFVKRYS